MISYVETEIGTVAPDWKIAPLAAVCEPPQYGYTASAAEEGNVRLLRITDITDLGVNWTSVPFCNCPAELVDRYRLTSGDIVFARIGATTGKSYLITNPPPSVLASYLIRVRAKGEVDPAFLSQFFHSDAYWRQVDAQKNANLKKGVSGSLLKTLLVPVPPLPEQRKIAAVLGLVQRAIEQQERLVALMPERREDVNQETVRAIEQQERLVALTTELKKALLHKLFTEGLRGEPQKETEIGPVPESWEIRRFGDYASFKNGINFTRSQKGNVGILTVDVFNMYGDSSVVSLDKVYRVNKAVTEDYHLRDGDLLFVRSSLKLEGVGWTSMFRQTKEPATHCGFIIRARLHDQKAIAPAFLTQYFRTSQARRSLVSGGAKVAITNINQGILQAMIFPKPPIEEQVEIAEAIECIDQNIQMHMAKKELWGDLFRALLHQLMTAQIRVNALDLAELAAYKAE